jgi:hypothetical protein
VVENFFWGGVNRLLFALRSGRRVRSGRRTSLGRELGVWVLVLYEVTQYSIRSAEQNNSGGPCEHLLLRVTGTTMSFSVGEFGLRRD